MAGHIQNLTPWPKGVSGNPGGRPKKKLITDELERLLEREAPEGAGKTWATVIAEALLNQARRGDVRAIAELANRIEGKPLQAVEMVGDAELERLVEELEKARKRVVGEMTDEELTSRIKLITAELGLPPVPPGLAHDLQSE